MYISYATRLVSEVYDRGFVKTYLDSAQSTKILIEQIAQNEVQLLYNEIS